MPLACDLFSFQDGPVPSMSRSMEVMDSSRPLVTARATSAKPMFSSSMRGKAATGETLP